MHIVISPAKKIDFKTETAFNTYTDIRFTNEATLLAEGLKSMSRDELAGLMNISSSLAKLNFDRYQNWHYPYTQEEALQAIFAFKGDVYAAMDVQSLSDRSIIFAQKHLSILSGLYGLLKPLDLILPYRLEMGTKLKNVKGNDLYKFWGDKITELLNQDMADTKSDILINLASNEYFKSINSKKLKAKVVTPIFKNSKNGEYKIISIFAKKARGLMTRYIIQNKIRNAEDLLGFNEDGYYFNSNLSSPDKPVFTREYQ
jgi:cytoplasmic iron level regulating protein YaaA (DUF328/UPF0246 family)